MASKQSLEKVAKGASMQLLGMSKLYASSAAQSASTPPHNAYSSFSSRHSVFSTTNATMQGAIPLQTLVSISDTAAPFPATSRRSSASSRSSLGAPTATVGQQSSQPVVHDVGQVLSAGTRLISTAVPTLPLSTYVDYNHLVSITQSFRDCIALKLAIVP